MPGDPDCPGGAWWGAGLSNQGVSGRGLAFLQARPAGGGGRQLQVGAESQLLRVSTCIQASSTIGIILQILYDLCIVRVPLRMQEVVCVCLLAEIQRRPLSTAHNMTRGLKLEES